MKIISGIHQGSESWLAHRRTTRNASDAPAVMGASPYVSRAQLIHQRATGIEREIDEATQRLFDRGHAVEPALRALAEAKIGGDLFPIVAVSDDGYLGCSFDGVTMMEDAFCEAKQYNAAKVECIQRGEIPPVDYWQLVQQFAVCESAVRCIYIVGDGTAEGSHIMQIDREQVEDDIPRLIAAWRQFDADVAAYVPKPQDAPAPTGHAPKALQALHIELRGEVTASNLAEFKANALGAISAVNRDLQTDQDFEDAAESVKWCAEVESRIEAAKQHALSQTRSIDELFRTMDEISAEARRVRLDLDRLVKARKESIRMEIGQRAIESVRQHVAAINATLGEHSIGVPASLAHDIATAMKGRKTVASLTDAADTASTHAKIEASQRADRIRACIAVLAEHAEHATLFPDRVTLCATKLPDDLRNLVAARVAEHQRREDARIEAERERIRAEEEAKAAQRQREAQAEAVAAVGPVAAPCNPGPTSVPAADIAPRAAPAASAPSGAVIKLGGINAVLAPVSISADGLAQLGFQPVRTDGAAKLYAAADLPRICLAIARRLEAAAQDPALSRHDENRHQLLDAVGKTVLIVVSDAKHYMAGGIPKADKDQAELPLGDFGDDGPVADNCPATAVGG